MRFSRTNMRLAAARCRSLSRKIGVQTAEFSITAFCWRNADSRKSRTYERHNAEIRLELFNLSKTSPQSALTARFESYGADSRLRLGWARRWSMRRIAARVTIASERPFPNRSVWLLRGFCYQGGLW